MKSSISVEIPKDTAKYILDVLRDHQIGYSSNFTPERIVKIRDFVQKLEKLV